MINPKHIDSFEKVLWNLKHRTGMYLFHVDYNSYVSFLIGYSVAMWNVLDFNFSDEFQKWLMSKVGNEFSLHWSQYILNELSEGKEGLALLKLQEEFINEYKLNLKKWLSSRQA